MNIELVVGDEETIRKNLLKIIFKESYDEGDVSLNNNTIFAKMFDLSCDKAVKNNLNEYFFRDLLNTQINKSKVLIKNIVEEKIKKEIELLSSTLSIEELLINALSDEELGNLIKYSEKKAKLKGVKK
jgi:hypothetical protein